MHGHHDTPESVSDGEETPALGDTPLDCAMAELAKALARQGYADIAGVRRGALGLGDEVDPEAHASEDDTETPAQGDRDRDAEANGLDGAATSQDRTTWATWESGGAG